jgi:hypothetical protein
MNVHDLADCLRAQSGGTLPDGLPEPILCARTWDKEEGVAFAELDIAVA